LSAVLARKGIAHHLDDWGWKGGHDWPYWKEQMVTYLTMW
jgi:esterase/lipase superfamily enzyme